MATGSARRRAVLLGREHEGEQAQADRPVGPGLHWDGNRSVYFELQQLGRRHVGPKEVGEGDAPMCLVGLVEQLQRPARLQRRTDICEVSWSRRASSAHVAEFR